MGIMSLCLVCGCSQIEDYVDDLNHDYDADGFSSGTNSDYDVGGCSSGACRDF